MQQQQQQQQQLQLQAQQEEWMRNQLAQQQTAQQQALLAQQQQDFLAAQAQQQARLAPQPTAFGFVPSSFLSFGHTSDDLICVNSSNNPFAITTSSASPVSSPQQPVQSSLSNFSLPSTYESHEPPSRQDFSTSPQPQPQPAPVPSPRPTPQRSQTRADQEHAHLANLFAARDGDGVDTFGNIGALRYATRASFLTSYVILMRCFFFLSS